MLCATVSCSSLAIRSRSSATRRAASASRSSPARRSRLAVSAASARLLRITSPSQIASPSTTMGQEVGGQRGESLLGGELDDEQPGGHEARGDGGAPDEVPGHRRVVERQEQRRSGEMSRRAKCNRRRSAPSRRSSPRTATGGGTAPAAPGARRKGSVRLSGTAPGPPPTMTLSSIAAMTTLSPPRRSSGCLSASRTRRSADPGAHAALRRRHAAHAVKVRDDRLERNARDRQDRFRGFTPIASTRTAGSASHWRGSAKAGRRASFAPGTGRGAMMRFRGPGHDEANACAAGAR